MSTTIQRQRAISSEAISAHSKNSMNPATSITLINCRIQPGNPSSLSKIFLIQRPHRLESQPASTQAKSKRPCATLNRSCSVWCGGLSMTQVIRLWSDVLSAFLAISMLYYLLPVRVIDATIGRYCVDYSQRPQFPNPHQLEAACVLSALQLAAYQLRG